MINYGGRWLIYISSYLPLYFLLIIQEISTIEIAYNHYIFAGVFNRKVFLFCLVLLILILLSLFSFSILFKKPNRAYKINENFIGTGDNILSYIMTYIVPMLSIDLSNDDVYSVIVNLILFFIIGLLYVDNSSLYLNPVISLLGYKVYTDSEGKKIIITKLSLGQLESFQKNDNKVDGYKIAKNLYVYKNKTKY